LPVNVVFTGIRSLDGYNRHAISDILSGITTNARVDRRTMRNKREIMLAIAASRHGSIVNDRAFLKLKGEERED
jgi:hypothetical protein